MLNLMKRGAGVLGRTHKTAGGRSVLYHRGGDSVQVTLAPNEHYRRNEGLDGIKTEHQTFSFKVVASELVLGGKRVQPQKGDEIEETLNGETARWAINPPDENSECWDWLDPNELLMIVHTKRAE